MFPEILPSGTRRPYTISVDADVPEGATIKVICDGIMPGGAPWHKEYTNPSQDPFDHAMIDRFRPCLYPAPDSLASPFLYAIIIEGDGKRQVFNAEGFADGIETTGCEMMRPKEGRPFIALKSPFLPHATISTSDTEIPFIFEIVGYTPRDSKIVFVLSFTQTDGSVFRQECVGPCRELIRASGAFQIDFQLSASSDGVAPPTVNGIAIEGGRRRHFLSAAQFVAAFGERVLETFQVFVSDDDYAVLTLKPIPPRFDGPPTILHRLHKLHEEGKLKAERSGS